MNHHVKSDDEVATKNIEHGLSGVEVLHGIDKALEGGIGAVIFTLKDQSILADDYLNEEAGVLENVEIREQKQRDEAYKVSKKKTGSIYEDKFNDDDPVADDKGMMPDASGRFTREAEKKLEELRRRIQRVQTNKNYEDLNAVPGKKFVSDYYNTEETVEFKKPKKKKKKSLRKKEKLDYDALQAEAKSSGLGIGDLGSRNNGERQVLIGEQQGKEAEMRSSAYQAALDMANEAAKALQLGQNHTIQLEEDEAHAITGDEYDNEEFQKSLQVARKLVLQKQGESEKSNPRVIASDAASAGNDSATEVESQENKEDGGWTSEVLIEEDEKDEILEEKENEIAPDETIHEIAVGKGLYGVLKLLKERGSFKESSINHWAGRNMDKKESKRFVGSSCDDEEQKKDIYIETTDEYGRTLTPKEAFRLFSHKFHGKGPGKSKQEKRRRQYLEELKKKQTKNGDAPSLFVDRMREAQAKLKLPYIVLSGNDMSTGFATLQEKDLPPTGLTPNKKVECISRKRKPGIRDTPHLKNV